MINIIKKDKKYLLYMALWVILTSISYAMFNLPLIWISFIPLIYVIHNISLKKIGVYGFIFGYLYYFCTLYWLIAFHEISAFFVFPIYALYIAMALIFTKYSSIRFPKIRFLVFPIIWLTFEILRSIGFFGFRWNTPADALWKQLVFLQSADIIGAWGVSFIVLLVNSTLAELFISWDKMRSIKSALIKNMIPLYITSFLFLCNLAYGISSFTSWKDIIDTKVFRERVTLMQPNRPGHSSWHREGINLSQEYLKMMKSVTSQNPDLFLQTEIMMSTYFWEEIEIKGIDHPANIHLKQILDFSKEVNIPIVITHFSTDNQRINSYNSATFVKFDKDKMITNTYRKIHLVPFGEWIPGSKKWAWLNNLLTSLGAAWASPGEELSIFTGKNGIKFALLICFEDIYAILGRLFVKKGVQYFVNSTNDGWAYKWKLGAKAPLWQHLANTTHTAISLRRSIARSVNTGISAVVDPTGRMDIAPLAEYKKGIYTAEVPVMPIKHQSLYVIWGWLVQYILFGLGILLILLTIYTDKYSQILKDIL